MLVKSNIAPTQKIYTSRKFCVAITQMLRIILSIFRKTLKLSLQGGLSFKIKANGTRRRREER